MRDLTHRWLSSESRRRLQFGKLTLLLLVIVAAAIAQGCTQILDDGLGGGADLGGDSGLGGGIVTPPAPVAPTGPLAADVRVLSDPEGGSYVSELSCSFEVSEIEGMGSNPIIITVAWKASCGTHGVESFVFDGGTQVFESSYSEGGQDIGLTFWATISWTDAKGNHQAQSGFAACSG